MGVSRINGVDAGQMAMAQATDSVSKSIQNQITSVQRQMQEISAKEDISVEERMKKRQELQQEISNLNTQLRQHEAELRKEQQAKAASANNVRENSTAGNGITASSATGGAATDSNAAGRAATGGSTTGGAPADSNAADSGTAEGEGADTGMSRTGMRAIVTVGSSVENARRQGTVVSRIEGGIGVLKAEIKQDTGRGAEVERKQRELAGLEERARKASEAQYSILGNAHQTMTDAVKTEQGIKTENNASAAAGKSIGNTLFSTTNLSKEKSKAILPQMNFSMDIRG